MEYILEPPLWQNAEGVPQIIGKGVLIDMAQSSDVGLEPAIHGNQRFFTSLKLTQPLTQLAGDAAFGFGAQEFVVFKENHAKKINAPVELEKTLESGKDKIDSSV